MKTTDPKKRALLDSLKDGLIVSCQVQKDDPIYTDDIVVKMAEAAKWAGAVAIRANSPEQIKAIKDKVDLPMIGLWKIWHDDTDVFITPTMDAARAVWEAGAEIIALDCTSQITHENTQAWDLIKTVKQEIPEAIIFADVSNMEEAARAVENGADYRMFAEMCRTFRDEAFVMMEGHIYTPEDAMKCIYLGAHSVVVGSAITRPHLTAKRFVDLLGGYQDNWRDAEKAKH